MSGISQILEVLRNGRLACAHRCDEYMSKYTSFRIGGPVSAMLFPKNAAELTELYRNLREYDVSPLVLGRGTNLLMDDKPL